MLVADFISSALRLIGQLAEGETPSNETANDALIAFNQMLDSWSAQRLSVFALAEDVYAWPVGQATQTIGPTGTLIGTRPTQIDPATYFVNPANNISYNLNLINAQQYNSIALKSATSSYPQLLYVNNTFPNMTLSVYPVPILTLNFHILYPQPLTQPATLATTLAFPPGYLRALRFGLAVEICAEFGIEPPPTVAATASYSRRDLMRLNDPQVLMGMPGNLLPNRYGFNIYSGD